MKLMKGQDARNYDYEDSTIDLETKIPSFSMVLKEFICHIEKFWRPSRDSGVGDKDVLDNKGVSHPTPQCWFLSECSSRSGHIVGRAMGANNGFREYEYCPSRRLEGTAAAFGRMSPSLPLNRIWYCSRKEYKFSRFPVFFSSFQQNHQASRSQLLQHTQSKSQPPHTHDTPKSNPRAHTHREIANSPTTIITMAQPPPPPSKKPHDHNGRPPLCPSHASNSGPNCALTPHPVRTGSRYCTTHQALCPSCPNQPAHPIGRQCKSCVWRKKAEKRAERAARVAEKEVQREKALEAAEEKREEAREAGRVREVKREGMGTEAVPKERKRRGRNKRNRRKRE